MSTLVLWWDTRYRLGIISTHESIIPGDFARRTVAPKLVAVVISKSSNAIGIAIITPALLGVGIKVGMDLQESLGVLRFVPGMDIECHPISHGERELYNLVYVLLAVFVFLISFFSYI